MAEVWSYTLEFRGERLELEERQLAVGRSRTCDVPIKDPSVSRRHAELAPGGGKIQVRDLGSSNGTFVNGQRVTESAELADGDTLALGDADLVVRVARGAAGEIPQLPASAVAPRPPGPVGEATGILQAESMRLAEEALDEAVEPTDEAEPTDELPAEDLPFPAVSPGAHMAPPRPTPAAEPEPPAGPRSAAVPPPASLQAQAIRHAGEPDTAPPEPPPSPMRTQAIPHLAGSGPPDAGPPEPPPSPMRTQAIPHLAGSGPPDAGPPELPSSPMRTQAIPHLAGSGSPDAGPPEPPPSPMRTQAIPHLAGEPPAAVEGQTAESPELPPSPLRTLAIQQDEPEPEAETEKVQLVEPPPAEPLAEVPSAPAPSAAMPAAIAPAPPPVAEMPAAIPPASPPVAEMPLPAPVGPVKDIREGPGLPGSGFSGSPPAAAAGTEPLPPPSGGKGEILPSLDGFDTTLGPGVEVPEAMQRARDNVAKAQESAGEPLADLYSRPIQLPPVAGFWIRALALIVDGVWMGALELAGWRIFELPGLALACAVGLLVVLAGWSVWGTTPGKRLLRLYVCTADGQAGLGVPRALLRLAAYLLSGLLLGIGFLMALSSSRQALHDRLAGTTVRRFG